MEVSTEVKALVHKASELYEQHFGELPTLAVFAPGRVNLIGEHVDYNGGSLFKLSLLCMFIE